MRRYQRATWITLLAVIAAAILFGDRLLGFIVDWLWFGEMGQRGLFWRVIGAQAELGLVAGLLLFAILYLNLRLAHRTAPALRPYWLKR